MDLKPAKHGFRFVKGNLSLNVNVLCVHSHAVSIVSHSCGVEIRPRPFTCAFLIIIILIKDVDSLLRSTVYNYNNVTFCPQYCPISNK